MKSRQAFLLFILLFQSVMSAQKLEYAALLISPALKENANAVVRYNQENVTIHSQNSLTLHRLTAITVLNEYGLRNLGTYCYYSNNIRVNKIEARVYDQFGSEAKVFRKKDFKDVAVADGITVFSDSRKLELHFTPVAYPFTMVFECEYSTDNTAQMGGWSAASGYFVSTQHDEVNVSYPSGLGFSYKETNFDPSYDVVKTETTGKLSYVAKNIPAIKYESDGPGLYRIAPLVNFRLDKFALEGVNGQAGTWKEFGKWYFDKLLTGTDNLSPETQQKVKQLIGDEKDPVKVARKLYQYMQDKTRYVSIQVGIGGYKPMLASDVDKLGYGDCKALSNYMRALLEVAGIPSYFTLVYSGRETKRGMVSDFVSPQGDHAILAMPYNNDYIWLECTSQTSPFGFHGQFTDGRDVLVIKPDGGEIVKTKPFLEKDNSQLAAGSYSILSDGSLSGSVSTMRLGASYDETYQMERYSAKQKEEFYKEYFSSINSLSIGKVEYANDREKISFSEKVEVTSPSYASQTGNRLMFAINAFHRFTDVPKRYRTRQTPFEVMRGYFEQDEITVVIPDGFDIEAMPSDMDVDTKYGQYKAHVSKKSDNSLLYKRSFFLKEGFYTNSEYEAYRQFCEQIAKCDAAKVVLVKKT